MLLSIEIKCILPLSLASLLLFFPSFSSSFTVFLCSGWLFTHRFLLAPSLCPLSICSSAVCVCVCDCLCVGIRVPNKAVTYDSTPHQTLLFRFPSPASTSISKYRHPLITPPLLE